MCPAGQTAGYFDAGEITGLDLTGLFVQYGIPARIDLSYPDAAGWVESGDDGLIVFQGRLQTEVLGLSGADVTLQFTEPDATLNFIMELFLPAEWHFGDSFPLLGVSPLFARINLLALGGDVADTPANKPVVVVAAAAFTDSIRGGVEFAAGLGFYGYIDPASPGFSQIGWIVAAPALVTGPIEYSAAAGTVSMLLPLARATLADLFTTGSGSVGITLESDLYSGLNPALNLYECGVRFSGELDFPGGDVELAFVMQQSDSGLLNLTMTGDALAVPPLDQLADYFGVGEAFVAVLPPEFQNTSLLRISSMVFGIGMADKSVQYAQLNLTSPAASNLLPWEIFSAGDVVFAVDAVSFNFSVFQPFDLDEISFAFNLTGRMDFGGVLINLEAALPAFRFSGALASQGSADLLPLVEAVFGYTGNLPDDLVISELDFNLDVRQAVFNFDLIIDGDWTIQFGEDNAIDFTELGFAAGYNSDDGPSGSVTASFLVGDSQFNAGFNLSETSALIYGSWNTVGPDDEDANGGGGPPAVPALEDLGLPDAPDEVGYQDLAIKLGLYGLPNLPENLNLNLVAAAFSLDFIQKEFVLSAQSLNYGSAVFAAGPNENQDWGFLFGVEVPLNVVLDLSAIDVLGILPAQDEVLSLDDLHFVAATTAIPAVELSEEQLAIIGGEVASGLALSLDLRVGSTDTYSFTVRYGGKDDGSSGDVPPSDPVYDFPPPPAPPDANNLPATVAPAPETSGQPVQRSFGPLSFRNLGFGIGSNDELLISLDASISLSGLTIDLLGLSGSFLPVSPYAIGFDLSGLDVTFASSGIEISAGLLKTEIEGGTEYTGEALIKLETFSVSAFGSWATVDGNPSLFVFAMLNTPIGGPPIFFITGLAGGFGYNRDLRLPTISNVSTYPLVGGARGTVPEQQVLQDLNTYMSPLVGNYWLALGLQWTSYEILQSYALATVSFGVNFEVSLMGVASLAMPPAIEGDPIPPIAEVEMELLIDLNPYAGFFAASAQLTQNSYILSRQAALTGGFAFYFWFGSNPNSRDFVVTIGGYHPQFEPPAHYPKNVPEVGFNWKYSTELSFKGGVYFALTPAAVMAGGNLHASWTSGDIKAWFDAEADFLVQYQPFHYDVTMNVDVGASYLLDLWLTTKTISVSTSVNLHLWGPDFAGTATIDIVVMKISFNFGASSQSLPPLLTWSEFLESFFPAIYTGATTPAVPVGATATNSLISAQPTSGLLKTLSDEMGETNWVIDPGSLAIGARLLIPVTSSQITFNGSPFDTGATTASVNAGPVDGNLTATLSVEIRRGGADDTGEWSLTPALGGAPKALWSKAKPDLGADALIPNTLAGFQLAPVRLTVDESAEVGLAALMFDESAPARDFGWSAPEIPSTSYDQTGAMAELESTLTAEGSTRAAIIASLNSAGLTLDPTPDVDDFAANAANLLLAAPVLNALGAASILR